MAPTIKTRHGTPGFICGGALDFGFAALYLPIRNDDLGCGSLAGCCYPGKDVSRRESLSLLFAVVLTPALLSSCGGGQSGPPALPQSVSPGWTRAAITSAAARGTAVCWETTYSGTGTALVSVCRYGNEGGAFDAVQRTPAAAQVVKFQEGRNLVLITWKDAPKANLTALIRAIQKSLDSKE